MQRTLMSPFHLLDDTQKLKLHNQLLIYATSVGGKNAFLKILELIRHSSPHPLISKTPILRFPKGKISWNKNIHRDNLTLLSTQMKNRTADNQNLMAPKEHKTSKNVTNMLRALGTLTMTVSMNNDIDGGGFEIQAFEMLDNETTLMNPFFELLFFSPVDTAKKLLNFELKENANSADSSEEE
jgi:hypothetical protein